MSKPHIKKVYQGWMASVGDKPFNSFRAIGVTPKDALEKLNASVSGVKK
ncbi:hypothetical protein [Enterobacter kobei]|nr:hypothetical protein [Enterobacter kobei]